MATVDKSTFDAIVTLLASQMVDAEARRAFIEAALAGNPIRETIDYTGAARPFTQKLVTQLIDSGETKSGKLAVVAVLEELKKNVGNARQEQIDSIITGIPTSADTISQSYIFISYSRINLEIVRRLTSDLMAAGINVWLDKVGLKPGTPDWEQALRDAIKDADAVLYMASPEARRSSYVRDELAIADMQNVKLYPVWIAGDIWIDCVPMGKGHYQFIDARESVYAAGIAQIVDALSGKQIDLQQSQAVPPKETEKSKKSLESDVSPRNPYKGLRAFRAEDKGDFFGRSAFIEDLINTLGDGTTPPRFLCVVGASGSGKSSVMMAGLLPALQNGAIQGSENWVYLNPFVPGTHPLENLAVTLRSVMPDLAISSIQADLRDPTTRGLHLLAKSHLKQSHKRLVLYIDQFEELFTLTESDIERQQFIDVLTTAVDERDGQVIVLASLRADFFDRPLQYPQLGALMESHSRNILPLSLSELHDVIREPADLPDVGLTFEDGLESELVFAVREQVGALPLLQFTLDQLFQRRKGRDLIWAAYHEIGGVRGALAKQAEQTYESLPSDQHRTLARALFLRLIEPGATEQDTTRRRATLSELHLPDATQNRILQETMNVFVAARLLVTNQVNDTRTIEVSHEALIREWERLGAWLRDARDDLRLQKAIVADVTEWTRRQKPDDMLYRGTVLEDAQAWAKRSTPSRDETMFLNESTRVETERLAEQEKIARRVQNFQRASIVLLLVAFIAALATGFSIMQATGARQQQQSAQNQLGTATIERGQADERVTLANERELEARTAVADADAQLATANFNADIAETSVNQAEVQADIAQTARFVAESQATQVYQNASQLGTQSASQLNAANTQSAVQQSTSAARVDAVNTQVADGQAQLETATVAYGEASDQLAMAETSSAIEISTSAARVDEVNTQVADGQVQLETATVAYGEAFDQLAMAEAQVETFNTEVAAGQVTLTAVATEVQGQQAIADSLRLSSLGEQFFNAGDRVTGLSLALYANYLNDSSYQAQNTLADLAYMPGVRHQLTDHTNAVTDVTYSPDGRFVASVGSDRLLIINDVISGEVVATYEHGASLSGLAYSPDGHSIVVASFSNTVLIFDAESGELVQELAGHADRVSAVAYSADGRYIVSGSHDNRVIMWDASTGEQYKVFEGHTDPIETVAISPNGQYVASGSQDNTVIIWDIESESLIQQFTEHTTWLARVVFTGDSERVISSAGVNTHLWRVDTGEIVTSFENGHVSNVEGIAFNSDETRIATASFDGNVIIWDVTNGEVLQRLSGHSDWVYGVDFSPDDQSIASASRDSTVIIWDVNRGNLVKTLEGQKSTAYSAIYSPDGRFVATGSVQNVLMIWDVASGTIYHELEVHTSRIPSVAFSADNQYLVSGSEDNTVIVWDVITGEVLRQLAGHTGWVTGVDFSPDGRYVASSSYDTNVIIWDVNTGDIVHQLDEHTSTVETVAFSPDGQYLASGSGDRSIIIWDVGTGEIVQQYTEHSNSVNSLEFSPDGQYIVSGSSDRTVVVWDIACACLSRRFAGHTDWVNDVAYSPDGQFVASASEDNTLIIWNVARGELVQTLQDDTIERMRSVDFSPDGTHIVSSDVGTVVKVWRWDKREQLIEWVQYNRAIREFTCQERASFSIRPLCTVDNIPATPTLAPTSTPILIALHPTWTPIASPTRGASPTPVLPTATPDMAQLAGFVPYSFETLAGYTQSNMTYVEDTLAFYGDSYEIVAPGDTAVYMTLTGEEYSMRISQTVSRYATVAEWAQAQDLPDSSDLLNGVEVSILVTNDRSLGIYSFIVDGIFVSIRIEPAVPAAETNDFAARMVGIVLDNLPG